MTADETRRQSLNTPEQVVQEAIYEYSDSWELNEHIVAALRAAGLLVEGAPTDEQVERALTAHDDHAGCRGDEFREYVCPECGYLYATVEDRKAGLDGDDLFEAGRRHRMRAALAAAGVAPPAQSKSSAATPVEPGPWDGTCSNPQCPLSRAHSGPCDPPAPSADRGLTVSTGWDRLAAHLLEAAISGDELENRAREETHRRAFQIRGQIEHDTIMDEAAPPEHDFLRHFHPWGLEESLWMQADDADKHSDALRKLDHMCTTPELESFVRIAASSAPLRQFEWYAEMIATHPQMRSAPNRQPEKGTDARR